jgi:hypothetical protein
MRKLAFLSVAFALVAVSFYGCDEKNPTEPAEVTEQTPTAPSLAVVKKPIKEEAYVAVWNQQLVAEGGRQYVGAYCPLGMWPVGGYFTINKGDQTGRLDSYEDIGIINFGITHRLQRLGGDGAVGYMVGIENNRTVVGQPTIDVGVRVHCFETGFTSGH